MVRNIANYHILQEDWLAATRRKRMRIYGMTVDDATRCIHYRSPEDIVAIKFACCRRYYPCFQCHAECEDHPARQWPRSAWFEKAILCGACEFELTISEYRAVSFCPGCGAAFNDGCRLHAHLYFDVGGGLGEAPGEEL
jgi:uncharacterized CHY-type Zn-finger protein